MPLTAVVDHRTIIAPDLPDTEWADLVKRHRAGLPVTMCCCGAPGHLRTPRNGVRHFYHAADSACGYAEESADHLVIKELVYRACRTGGWDATVERPAPDRSWIADVLAEKDGRQVAFEIQRSAIAPEDLAERDRKYRTAGIESYWLLDRFIGRTRDFTGWFDPWLREEVPAPGTIPSLDPSFLHTGPENHIFIPAGIRSIGLDAKHRSVFSTGNPSIPVPVWVREVLNGNYGRYLDGVSADFHRRRRLAGMAAPALVHFHGYYRKIVRDRTYRNRAGLLARSLAAAPAAADGKERRKALAEIASELDWLEGEYRTFMTPQYGLFSWTEPPGNGVPRPVFRPMTEQGIRRLQDCIGLLDRWEASFIRAAERLERQAAGPGH